MDDATSRRDADDPRPDVTSTPSRSRLFVLLGVLTVVLVVAVWFQPQKLFLDDTVDDAFPSAGTTVPADEMLPDKSMDDPMPEATPSGTATAQPAGPQELLRAAFEGRAHTTTGEAAIFDVAGAHVLRFEDLATDNGPDLVVYLSASPATATGAALVADIVDLGALKGNLGNQNYDVPDGTDLDRYRTVVIWCRRFNVTFAVAALS